jgi:thiamine pyrophosphate-dependent acetolactate synthase large subunit-like protein
MDLNEPALDFVEIAHGMGVAGKRISQPDEIASAVQEALASGAPYLVEVMTEGRIPAQ